MAVDEGPAPKGYRYGDGLGWGCPRWTSAWRSSACTASGRPAARGMCSSCGGCSKPSSARGTRSVWRTENERPPRRALCLFPPHSLSETRWDAAQHISCLYISWPRPMWATFGTHSDATQSSIATVVLSCLNLPVFTVDCIVSFCDRFLLIISNDKCFFNGFW